MPGGPRVGPEGTGGAQSVRTERVGSKGLRPGGGVPPGVALAVAARLAALTLGSFRTTVAARLAGLVGFTNDVLGW